MQDSHRAVAEARRPVGAYGRLGSNAVLANPIVKSVDCRTAGFELAAGNDFGEIVDDAIGARGVEIEQRQAVSRLDGLNPGHLPVPQGLSTQGVTVAGAGQFVNRAEHEALRANEIIGTVIKTRIVVISIDDATVTLSGAPINVGEIARERVGSQELEAMAEAFAQSGFEGVVPGKAGIGFNVEELAGGKALVRDTQWDIREGIGSLAANGVIHAG